MCVRGLCVPLELWWSIYSLAVTGCASLIVVGESTQLAGGVRLYLQWRGPFLGVMSEIISLIMVGNTLQFFQVGSSVVVAMGFS